MKFLTPVLILIVSFMAAGVAYAHGGGTEGKVCPAVYAPVCASHPVQCVTTPCYPQYQTYGNSCEAAAHEATVLHQGECTANETGPVKPSAEAYKPPATCTAWFDGCNSCTKTANGTACTLKACVAPAAGYCTAYEAQKPPVVTTPPVEQPVATATPTEPESEHHESALTTIWNWIKNLFGW